MDALWQTKSITSLYTHQAEAIKHLGRGDNVIVSTSTSSGKSLIYQLPALSAFEKDPESTVMFIFPTKALAQDQKRALGELLSHCPELGDVKVLSLSECARGTVLQVPKLLTKPELLPDCYL